MGKAKEGAEARKRHRHSLLTAVAVYDHDQESFLGRLVNVHEEGLMMMGNRAFESEHIYQLDLHLADPIDDRTRIHLAADCLWTREEDEYMHWAGCRIIDISDQAMTDLKVLISQYGE